MARKIKYAYGNYRPLRKGEKGYSPTSRRMVDDKTQTIVSRYTFENMARKATSQQTRSEKAISDKSLVTRLPVEKKPRKTRIDKGMSRSDYKLFKKQYDYIEQLKKRKKVSPPPQKRLPTISKSITTQQANNRFVDMKILYNRRKSAELQSQGLEPIDDDASIDDSEFYSNYDVMKHPNDYTSDEIYDAKDYLYDGYEDYMDEPVDEIDYPWGETP